MLKKIKGWNVIVPFFLFVITFYVYTDHLSVGIFGGDAGDFITAIAVRGIPHAPGYPLFTLLGILFSFLPFGHSLSYKIGLISALSSSASVVILYLISLKLTKRKTISVITSLSLAFFPIFWLYAEIAEVFALYYFFILLLFYLSLIFKETGKKRFFYFFSFFFGLSLTHHQAIVLFLPGFFVILFPKRWKNLLNAKTILISMSCFSLGLLPYLYIPFSALNNPPYMPGEFSSISDFFRIIFRLNYGWSPAEAVSGLVKFLMLKFYFQDIGTKLTLAGIIPVIFGGIYLYLKKQWIFLLSFLISFFLSGAFFIFYAFSPITNDFYFGVLERFYMQSVLILFFVFPFGIMYVGETLVHVLKKISLAFSKKSYYSTIFTAVFFLLPLSFYVKHNEKMDLKEVFLSENLAKDILAPLPENSVLFLYGDNELYSVRYTQLVLNFRKDVTVISLGGLITDKTYMKIKREIERNNPQFTPEEIEFETIIYFAKDAKLFSQVPIHHKVKNKNKFNWIPYGLVLKLRTTFDKQLTVQQYAQLQDALWIHFSVPIKSSFSPPQKHLTLIEIPKTYANSSVQVGKYMINQYKDFEKGKIYFQRAIFMDETLDASYMGIGEYYLKKMECEKAAPFFEKVIELNKSLSEPYQNLYYIYTTCFNNQEKAKKISEDYSLYFHRNISEDVKKILHDEKNL